MPRGGPRPGSGRPKGSKTKGKVTPLDVTKNDDPVVGVLLAVMKSDACTPELRVKAAEGLSRHAAALRQANERRGARRAKGVAAVYEPSPLGWLHTAGRTKEAGMEALAKHMRGEEPAGE